MSQAWGHCEIGCLADFTDRRRCVVVEQDGEVSVHRSLAYGVGALGRQQACFQVTIMQRQDVDSAPLLPIT